MTAEDEIVVAIEEPQSGSLNGSDDQIDGAGGELEEGGGALLLHVGMRGKILEGKDIVRRKAHHASWIDGAGKLAPGLDQLLQRLGGFVVRHHHDDGLARFPRHEREIESASGCGHSRDTPPPRTQAQMPAYAFKSRGMLQFREDFADERENHQIQV